MPLESGTFISDLVSSNPAASDGLTQADDHIRLIKSVLKNTFPNINAAVTLSDEQLNALTTTTEAVLNDGSAATPTLRFGSDTNTGLFRVGDNVLGLSTNGVLRVSFSDTQVLLNNINLQGVSSLGSVSGTFSQSLTAGTFITAGTNILSTGGRVGTAAPSVGNVQLTQGNGSLPGLMEFLNSAGTRLGYIGYGVGTNIQMRAEAGWGWSIEFSGILQINSITNNPYKLQFQDNGTTRGYIYSNATYPFLAANAGASTLMYVDPSGNFTAVGNVSAYSDLRLKEDIRIINNPLAKLFGITGVTYTRKDMEDRPRHAGVIAQDVQNVLPEAISEGKGGTLTVSPMALVGLLIESVKELTMRVEALEHGVRS